MADAGLFGKSDDGYGLDAAAANDLKALANQGVFPDDIYQNKIENEDNKNVDKPLIEDDLQVQNKSDAAAGPEFSTKVFSQHQSFSPTSSGMSPNGNSSAAIVGRKRRSRDEVVDDISGEPSGTRKSLRGAGVKSTRGKRPKVAVVSNV